MKRFLVVAIGLIAAAFYVVCFWDITPEVAKQKQTETYVVVHVENTTDYAEVYRAMRKRW